MKALNRYYSRKERTALIVNTLILIAFIAFTINMMTTKTDLPSILTLGFILVFFTANMILKEVLNFFFQKAIYQLTAECDPLAGMETMKLLRKYDIYKGYTTSFVAFSSLVYVDTDNAQALLDLFAPGNKLTQTGKDMILIKSYSLYKAYVILNNKTQMKKAYADLIRLKVLTNKKKGVSPLYAWFDIEAEYALLTNDVKEASGILAKADIRYLNPRERAHHYMLVAQVEKEKGNRDEAKSFFSQVTKIANKMVLQDKALQALEELNHEKTQKTRR